MFSGLFIAGGVWAKLRALGPIGEVLLGLADASVVPTPGSLDLLLILLVGSSPHNWWIYVLAATIGSSLGAYITYGIGVKGGKEGLAKRIPERKVKNVYRWSEKYGVGAVAVPAFLPPPFPLSPFLLAAGVMIRRRKACSLRRCGVARTEIWAVDCSGDAAVFAADHLDTDRSSRTWGTRNGSLPVAPEAKRIADAAFGREEGSVNSGGRLVSPTQKRGSHRESGSNRREQHKITFFQLAFIQSALHGQRNSSGGGISILTDIDDDAI